MIRENHYGSTIGIIIGVLSLLTCFSEAGKDMPPKVEMFVFGFIIILGAAAYRSAKLRKLNKSENPKKSLVLEIIAIVVIKAFVGLQRNILDIMEKKPVVYLIAPLWVIIAYLIISFSSGSNEKPKG